MKNYLSSAVLLLLFLSSFDFIRAEDAGDDAAVDDAAVDDAAAADDNAGDDAGYYDDGGGGDDDDGGNDDARAANYYFNDDANDADDDYIKYWAEYAILPKRCIVYNDVDVIVYSMYAHGYKQCTDEPMGHYITPVSYFVSSYLDQEESDAADQEMDDFVLPDAAQYTECTGIVIENQQYYMQLGCSDESSQALAVNIYSDNTCETRSVVDGYDDANIDLSGLEIPFKKCKLCVVWIDKADDEIDDMFYENRRRYAPLCSQVWGYKDECDRKCQRIGLERGKKEGWNTSDKVLLGVLSLFGAGMLFAILRKRQKMSNKDTLLEQAAMSAAGLQQMHVVGIFALALVIITIFASLRMKQITWGMMLLLNLTLFSYLMKLTVDSGVEGDGILNADGTVTRIDSEDSSIASDISGTQLPALS